MFLVSAVDDTGAEIIDAFTFNYAVEYQILSVAGVVLGPSYPDEIANAQFANIEFDVGLFELINEYVLPLAVQVCQSLVGS